LQFHGVLLSGKDDAVKGCIRIQLPVNGLVSTRVDGQAVQFPKLDEAAAGRPDKANPLGLKYFFALLERTDTAAENTGANSAP
jgi:hypothetical protein